MKIKVLRIVIIVLLSLAGIAGIDQVSGSVASGSLQAQTGEPALAMDAATTEIYLPLLFYKPPYTTMFGVEMYSINEAGGLEEMETARASWVRRNSLRWSQIESTKGVYNWAAAANLETEFINARGSGMEVVLIIRSTPSWAQEYPGIACGPMKASEFQSFANFMKEVVKRYSSGPYQVEYYEIWNEPDVYKTPSNPDNIYGCWLDPDNKPFGGQHYGEMLKVVYPAVKQANPNAKLLVGGLLLDCDPNNPPIGKDCDPSLFLERVLSVGAGNSFDGVSFHAYDYYAADENLIGKYRNPNWNSTWDTNGSALTKKADYLRSVLSSYGVGNKFLMNTELALLCYGDSSICEANNFNETKAIYVTHSYVDAFVKGLRANIWYSVFGWQYSGLFQPDLTPYPAYHAYSFTSNMLALTQSWQTLSLGEGVRAYEFELPEKRVWVLWSQDGTNRVVNLGDTPDAAWKWDSGIDQYVSTTAQPSPTVGVAPLFLEWLP